MAMGRARHADFEEESRPFDIQSVGVEMVKKNLLGEKHAAELGKVAVDMVELFARQGGLKVIERVAEGGFLAFEVANDLRQVEELTSRGFQRFADGIIVALDACVDGGVVFWLDIKDGIARVEFQAWDGDELGFDAFGFGQP